MIISSKRGFSRNIYILTIAAAIVVAFTSFFSNETRALVFLLAIILDTYVNKTAIKSKPLQCLIVFYLISFFYVFALSRGHFSEIRNILLPYPMMLMCFWVAPELTKLSIKEAKFIWFVFLICLVENLIVTTIIGQVDPRAVRNSFQADESELDIILMQTYSRLGVLSYQASHLLPLVCTTLVVIACEISLMRRKFVALFIAFLAVYAMYLMTITTALLLGVICMVAIFLFYFSKGNVRRFFVLFSLLAVLLLVTGGLTSLLFSSSQGGNSEIAEKLNDVAESIVSGKGQGQVEGRELEYNKTTNAIFRNPIFGGANGPEDTGQHALFFDYWAYYGVFCLFLFVGWWKEVKRMKRMLNKKRWNAYLICLLPIVMLCFLKGPVFLPYYVLATTVIIRVAFIANESEPSQAQSRLSIRI